MTPFLLATSLADAAIDPAVDPASWLRALDAATPATESLRVANLRLDFGPARLSIEEGVLIPVRGPSPRVQELLFFG